MLRTDAALIVVSLVLSSASAFTVNRQALLVKSPPSTRVAMAGDDEKGGFFMSDKKEEKVAEDKTKFVSSVFKKELAFDEASGRFFETGFGEGDCIPEDEFCVVDKDTGNAVRLTVEEKERIFLDALQVSILCSLVKTEGMSLLWVNRKGNSLRTH